MRYFDQICIKGELFCVALLEFVIDFMKVLFLLYTVFDQLCIEVQLFVLLYYNI